MNTSMVASSQAALAGASFTTFSAITVESRLAGMSVQKNNGPHIQTPIENIGERVLKPLVDSLGYWGNRSVELLNNFLSLPGADAATEEHNQTIHNQRGVKHPVASRIASLNRQFNGDVSTAKEREEKGLFVPYAEELLSLAEKEQVVDSNVGLLAGELGNFFRLTGNFPKARAYCEQGLNAYIIALGTENHLSVAGGYNNLANTLKAEGNLSEAKRHYERALSILVDQHKTEDHPSVGLVYNNLSIIFLSLGNTDTAMMFAEKAVKVQYAVYGAQGHPNLAMALNSLGNAQKAQGDFLKAEESFLESLRVRESLPETESQLNVGVTYNNLGIVLQAQGNFTGAKSYFTKALKLKSESYGEPNHTEIAITYTSLASLLQAEGDLDGAEKTHRKALEIFTASYKTEQHPNVALSLNNLGLVLAAKKDLVGAQECFQKAIAIKEKLNGNPLDLAGGYKNLANIYKLQGDFENAKQTFKKSLESYTTSLKTEKHQDIVAIYKNIGDACLTLKQFQEAKTAYEKAKKISQQLFKDQHDAFFDRQIQKCGK